MTMASRAGRLIAGFATAGILILPPAPAVAGKNFGCFQVITPSLNIRARPYSDAAVIGTASAGQILEKRKRWCTLRGYWCAVRKGSVEGYADKSFLGSTKCP
jgi:hypothetical protein